MTNIISLVLMLAGLLGTYSIAIAALTRALGWFGLPKSRAALASFLIFGVAAGMLAVMLWPMESAVYASLPAIWLGDWTYRQAIQFLGDPRSAQAHYTIPWFLRVPQVYAVTSIAFWSFLGVAAQFFWNRRSGGGIKRRGKLLADTSN